ncbi:hypothetical protein ACU6U9_05910 [Pseudomonas sp. HK3]
MSFTGVAYENQCASVFSNGLQSHNLGNIEIDRGARMQNGLSHQLFAKKVKLNRSTGHKSCGTKACIANGLSSTVMPAYSFKYYNQNNVPRLGNSFNHRWWFQTVEISEPHYKNVTIKPFSTGIFSHSGGQFIAKNIFVKTGAKLKLKPGDYWVENLHLSTGAAIESNGPGQIRLFTRQLTGDFTNNIGSQSSPHHMLIVSKNIKLGSHSNIHAFIYADENIKLGFASKVSGALSGKNIELKSYSKISFQADKAPSINFAWLCDFDNDGIYDGIDTDADNDGFSDELEIQAGSDIYDAQSTPADLDNDGLPDVIDDDIDGDGYSNEQEEADGTDPYDPDSFKSNPPTITLSIESGQTIEQANIHISGLVGFGDLNISKLFAYNINTPNQIQLINLSSDGTFLGELNLVEGLNEFEIVVEDTQGAQAHTSFTVTYVIPFQILSVTPSNGTDFSEAVITIVADIKSNVEPQLRINNQLAQQQLISENMYQYTLEYSLTPGSNDLELVVLSGQKTLKQSLNYSFQPADMSLYPAPHINVLTPNNNTRTAQSEQPLTVDITSNVGGLTASINNNPVNMSKSGEDKYRIAQPLHLTEGQNQYTIKITDALGQKSTQTLALFKDTAAPQITLAQNYLAPPDINTVASNRFTIKGSVIADDLATLSIAGQVVSLQQIDATHYEFEHRVNIAANQETLIAIQAKDTLGNSSTLAYYFYASSNLTMSWVSPQFPVQWILEMGTQRPFAIKTKDASGSESYSIELTGPDKKTTLPFTKINDLLTGSFSEINTKGEYQISVTATENGQLITQMQNKLTVISQDDLPVEITHVQPVAESANLEPDVSMQVNFNRPIDVNKLSIVARRTLHGKTYVNLDASGVDFLHAKGMQLLQVDVDREQVSGNLSILPNDSAFVFYPTDDLGYNAQIEWIIAYDGAELSKQRFTTRPLPTVIDGGVKDTFSQSIEGITVEIEELGLKTTTNNDGGYAFGYGSTAAENIPSGRYHMLINKGYTYPKLGEVRIPVDIKQGRRNQLPLLRVPNVSDQVQWINVPTDAEKVRLAQGEFNIEFSPGARLRFPDDRRTNRAIHAQFISASNLVRDVYPGSAPLWFYQLQPFGIKTTGPLNIKMKVPALNGNMAYMMMQPGETKYSFLLGYNTTKNVIEPIGVVKIHNGYMETLKPVEPASMDYFGYTHTKPEYHRAI